MRTLLLTFALVVAGAALVAAPADALGTGFGVHCTGTLGVAASTDPPSAGVTTPDCAATLPDLPMP